MKVQAWKKSYTLTRLRNKKSYVYQSKHADCLFKYFNHPSSDAVPCIPYRLLRIWLMSWTGVSVPVLVLPLQDCNENNTKQLENSVE